MQQAGASVPAARAVLVTVHGTWASEAPWTRPDSALGRAMLEWFAGRGIAATVVAFEWSGRNSIAARRAAGASLAERLEHIHRTDPLAALYVIAHSHGGSVFAYATERRPEIVDEVDGFIALATPWIGLRPCTYAPALREMLAHVGLYIGFVATLLAVAFIVRDVYF